MPAIWGRLAETMPAMTSPQAVGSTLQVYVEKLATIVKLLRDKKALFVGCPAQNGYLVQFFSANYSWLARQAKNGFQ
jgi:hypothetical protein